MSAFATVIARISKTKTKRVTVGKKIGEKFNLTCLFCFEADAVVALGLKKRNKFACSAISSPMSAMLFASIFPRAQRASTFDISAERNLWLQSALRSFAIVCDYMETALFEIVCDQRSSATICDHMETFSHMLSCSRLFEAKTTYFYFVCIISVSCQGSGGGSRWVRVLSGGSGRLRVGSASYIHPNN